MMPFTFRLFDVEEVLAGPWTATAAERCLSWAVAQALRDTRSSEACCLHCDEPLGGDMTYIAVALCDDAAAGGGICDDCATQHSRPHLERSLRNDALLRFATGGTA